MQYNNNNQLKLNPVFSIIINGDIYFSLKKYTVSVTGIVIIIFFVPTHQFVSYWAAKNNSITFL